MGIFLHSLLSLACAYAVIMKMKKRKRNLMARFTMKWLRKTKSRLQIYDESTAFFSRSLKRSVEEAQRLVLCFK